MICRRLYRSAADAADVRRLPGAEHHHGLALDVDQTLLFQGLEYPADHLARAADDTTYFLAGDLDLHAVRVGHGIGLLAQLQQGARDPAGDIQEGEIADLAGSAAQAVSHLPAYHIEQLGIAGGDLTEFGVGQLGEFAFGLGLDPGAAVLLGLLFVKQAHFAEEIARVEVGDDHIAALVVLDRDGDRALDDIEQAIGNVSCMNDGTARAKAPTITMSQKHIEIFYFGYRGESSHFCHPVTLIKQTMESWASLQPRHETKPDYVQFH